MCKSVRMLAIIVALGLLIGGIGCKEGAAQTEDAGFAAQPEFQESIELTGMVLSDNTFEDEEGDSYQLADTEKNELLQDLVGRKIKVEATVMENDEGIQEISVISYDLIWE